MSEKITKIKFKKTKSMFYQDLRREVKPLLTDQVIRRAQNLMYSKLVFYLVCYVFLYLLICSTSLISSFGTLVLVYTLFGLSGILLAFNTSHDAVHNTLFKNKKLNAIHHYLVFNLQGVSATLWKSRHIESHHIFPNVDGCDADIDDNPFIRLSESHKHKQLHKYQHLYAPFLYCLYTLHWIFIKDFMYLGKSRVANMTDIKYSKAFIIETILLKVLYLIIVLGLPICLSEFSALEICAAFFIMHFCISIFFVLTLIISHLTLETAFPMSDESGVLPFDYYEHQLAVSMDYHPTSMLANWIFGGFNSHSAHHLFPHMKHTLYPLITPSIEKVARKYGLPYNELSMTAAIISHFNYLKALGRGIVK